MVLRKRDFSLIELLVMISTLAILASLVMPTLRKTLAVAQMTGCKSNQKQIFSAMTLYIEDSKGICPGPTPGGQLPQAISKYGTTYNTLSGYLSSYLIPISLKNNFSYLEQMVCPTNKEQVGYDKQYFERVNYLTASIKGFGRPFGYPKNSNGTKDYAPASYTSIPSPSTAVVMEDADFINYPVPTFINRLPPLPLHINTIRNTLYFDGHLESIEHLP
jgi:type II secretory pathway pseudopilin PulG